jgi:tetratricopeptide (TPR) repeat protein
MPPPPARPLRVLHVESPNSGKQGDHVYRTRQPCDALGRLAGVQVASGSLLAPAVQQRLTSADVLVLCDVIDPDLFRVLDARRAAGRLTVYEVNDHFLSPQSWSPTAYLAENLVVRSLSSQLAAQADGIQVTAPEIRREFGRLHTRWAVFANQLQDVPPLPPPLPAPAPGERVWLGWGGSLGHREDVRWVWPALRAALDRHPSLGLSVMASPELRDLFTGVAPDRLRFTPAGSLERYYEFLRGLYLGVCPLLPTDFNRCRSDVKFVEFAAHGIPVLCADLAPYRDSLAHAPAPRGMLFGSLEMLGLCIDRLLLDRAYWLQMRANAYAYVSEHRREQDHAQDRLAQYVAWAGEVFPQGATPLDPTDDPWPTKSADEPGGHEVLTGGEGELALRAGLEAARTGSHDEACALYRSAARLLPDSPLPWLYLGTDDPDFAAALRALDRASVLAQDSVSVAFLRGCRLEEGGLRAEARAAFEVARALAPAFGAAEARLGELAEAEGKAEEAASSYARALAANPYYFAPAIRLATNARAAGTPEEALEVLEVAAAHDPSTWALQFLMGRLHVEAGRWQQGRTHLHRALAAAPEPALVMVPLAKAELALGNVAMAKGLMAELRRLSPAPA